MKTPTTRTRTVRPLLWNTHHDQPESRRVAVVALLNAQLADIIDLGLQAKQAHWNVKGPQFGQLHDLFDDVAEELGGFADDLAERAVQLGGVARGTLQTVAADSRLAAYTTELLDGAGHLWALSSALARVAQTSRAAIRLAEQAGDAGTVDVFTQVSRGIDKLLWKVEAHVAF